MFAKHKFSVTMRYFILLELNLFTNRPPNSSHTTPTSLQRRRGETHFARGLTKRSRQRRGPATAVPALCQNPRQVAPRTSRSNWTSFSPATRTKYPSQSQALALFLLVPGRRPEGPSPSGEAGLPARLPRGSRERRHAPPAARPPGRPAPPAPIFRCHGLIRSYF